MREGLAKRQLDCQDKFYRHNEEVIAESLRLAAKTRRPDWIVDEYTLYRFYDERVPHDVHDMASLRYWLKSDKKHREAILMRVEDLLPTEEAPRMAAAFPDQVEVGSLQLPLEYRFSPGQADDGLTVTVPADALGQLPLNRMEWLVPGLLEEKIVGLIRSLPKSIRRGLIPAPIRRASRPADCRGRQETSFPNSSVFSVSWRESGFRQMPFAWRNCLTTYA